MLSDPANRSDRFLVRLSCPPGLTGAILPCSNRWRIVVRLLILLAQSFVKCRTHRKAESS
jgi:hypothetical protein